MLLLAAACAKPNFGDDPEDVRLPDRGAPRSDAGHAALPPRSSATTDGADAQVDDPPLDAGVGDAPRGRSALCSEADLVICYEFEGVVKDSSINALDPEAVQSVSFVAGKSGLGAALDGQSVIRFGYSPLWTPPAGAATIEAWIELSPIVTTKSVVFDADGRFAMEIESNGQLKCITPNDSVTGGSIVKGQLTHVACTIDGNNKIRNYVGGLERDNGNGRVSDNETLGAAIGMNAPSGDPFVGIIDSVRVFRRARTAAEIAQAAQ